MTEKKKMVEFLEEAIRSKSHHITIYTGFGSTMLTEIRNALEQYEPDKVIDGIKYCGRCLVGVKEAPPDDELVEKIHEVAIGYWNFIDPDIMSTSYMIGMLCTEILKLLQSRKPVGTEEDFSEFLVWLDGLCIDEADEKQIYWRKSDTDRARRLRKKLSPESEGGEDG